ncbi:diguanylate cyclase [Angustibacter sp. McL0619]|uniref:sensor domain-containing diguanylate cyclase n=1 Tax=Angustibacter sp. McL0619 TaxID=3415676 RepID=UPI003CF4FB13
MQTRTAQVRPPYQEAGRLAALRDYGLLDGRSWPELDALLRLAAQVSGIPNVSLNIIDRTHQRQIATVGFAGRDTPRDDSMCAQHFLAGRPVVVADASMDPRFADSPWVGGELGHVRFYASIPLVTAGRVALGTLCLFDNRPDDLAPTQLAALTDLATVLLGLLEQHRAARLSADQAERAENRRVTAQRVARELETRQELFDAVLASVAVGIVACDQDGNLTVFNQAARDWHGAGILDGVGAGDWVDQYDLYEVDGVTPLAADKVPLLRALEDGHVENIEIVIAPRGGKATHALCFGRSLTASDGTTLGAVVAMADVTEERVQQAALSATKERLELSERRFRSMFEDSPVGIGLSDEHGHFVAANAALCQLLGRAESELRGSSTAPFTHPEDLDGHRRAQSMLAEGNGFVRIEKRYVRPSGEVRWAWLSVSSVEGPQGQDWTLAHIQDVTDRKQAELELRDSQETLSAIAKVARCAQFGTDPRPVVVRAVRELVGAGSVALVEPDGDELVVSACDGIDTMGVRTALGPGTLIGRVFATGEVAFLPDAQAFSAVSKALAELSGTRAVLCQPVTSDGRTVAILLIGWLEPAQSLDERIGSLVSTLAAETGAALTGAMLRQRLESLATTDPLTGLVNRRGWHERLQVLIGQVKRSGESLTLAVADLDHFKAYNDANGHEAGDELLRGFADLTTGTLREVDLVARWGGEEFAIALPGSKADEAVLALERLRAGVPGGQTCSFGLATWDGVESLTACLARADQALYRAKVAGRDRISR